MMHYRKICRHAISVETHSSASTQRESKKKDNFSRRLADLNRFFNHYNPLNLWQKTSYTVRLMSRIQSLRRRTAVRLYRIKCGKIMIEHNKISDSNLRNKIKNAEICFGGNRKLKIYGTLKCSSGKRMKRENRVFFSSENEAKQNGFRPCGHCMKPEYLNWKNGLI